MTDRLELRRPRRALYAALRPPRRVYLIGNGGSYANAVHVANDLLAYGVRAFTLDPATLTASANDHGYETVFERWIRTVGDPGDLLIALSGSGRSQNILRAIAAAEEIGMLVHLETDFLRRRDMQQSEEDQLRFGHDLMRSLRR